jgi:hypothetical protein
MGLITRGFTDTTIITRGYGAGFRVVRDIARITSKVILSVSLISKVMLSATVTSKLDLERDA